MKGNGSNEFIYFLAAGLLILAVLLVFMGADIYKFGGKNQTHAPGIIEAVKTFSIPEIKASNVFAVQDTRAVSKSVFSGLLFGEDKIVYDINRADLQSVKVKFTVTDTNYLGRLVIKANGNVVAIHAFNPGDHEVDVPAEFISNRDTQTLQSNVKPLTIEISAESSYWKIWAPTIYRLENVVIEYSSYSAAASQYKFYLGEEYINLEFAKADIALNENVGTLVVDVNGRTAWKSPVSNLQSIVIDKSYLRLGDNIIKFRAERDSTFSGRGTVVVIFLTKYPETINQTGIVAATQPLVGYSNQFYA